MGDMNPGVIHRQTARPSVTDERLSSQREHSELSRRDALEFWERIIAHHEQADEDFLTRARRAVTAWHAAEFCGKCGNSFEPNAPVGVGSIFVGGWGSDVGR